MALNEEETMNCFNFIEIGNTSIITEDINILNAENL